MSDAAAQIALWAQKGAALGDCGRMCKECAFRHGSVANREPHNVNGAMQALLMGEFHCHPPGDNGDAGKICSGFRYAQQFLER